MSELEEVGMKQFCSNSCSQHNEQNHTEIISHDFNSKNIQFPDCSIVIFCLRYSLYCIASSKTGGKMVTESTPCSFSSTDQAVIERLQEELGYRERVIRKLELKLLDKNEEITYLKSSLDKVK